MKFSKILLGTVGALLLAAPAFGSATFTVTATTGDGSPLSAITPGTTLSFAISLNMSAVNEMVSIGASVNDWDPTLATQNASASIVPATVLNTGCFPTFGCVGGINNVETGLRDSGIEGFAGTNGTEATFLSILGFSGAGDTGAIEIAELGPQFTVVFDIPLAVSGETTFRIGTFTNYADEFNGATDNIVNNASVAVTVPEPGSVAASACALASVFGVVALRRRS